MPGYSHSPQELLGAFLKRYGTADVDSLKAVLIPALLPIASLNKDIIRIDGQNHYRASFEVEITEAFEGVIQVGRTGKFVPHSYVNGGTWSEIAKGRILSIDPDALLAKGEVYFGTGASKSELTRALSNLSLNDYLEIDQFGAAAKILSGLVEYQLAEIAKKSGFKVIRMPEDMARHLGSYANYDFEFRKGGEVRKVEVKSLWGTDTRKARLIHSKTTGYRTSSCKFETQDIFAVSLFLRTGNIEDFAFARSVSKASDAVRGLPFVARYPEHVSQNPTCSIGDGIWFGTIEEVW